MEKFQKMKKLARVNFYKHQNKLINRNVERKRKTREGGKKREREREEKAHRRREI